MKHLNTLLTNSAVLINRVFGGQVANFGKYSYGNDKRYPNIIVLICCWIDPDDFYETREDHEIKGQVNH